MHTKSFAAVLTALFACVPFASAVPVSIEGSASGSGFAERPGGSSGVSGPIASLEATYALTYDDALVPQDGAFLVDLDSLALTIGDTQYTPANGAAQLNFTAGRLSGVTVGGTANGGPVTLAQGSHDFLFANVGDVQTFEYTLDGVNGLFEVLAVAGVDAAAIGSVAVSADPVVRTVNEPAGVTALLALGILGATAIGSRRRRR